MKKASWRTSIEESAQIKDELARLTAQAELTRKEISREEQEIVSKKK
jgi:hypothetical protein